MPMRIHPRPISHRQNPYVSSPKLLAIKSLRVTGPRGLSCFGSAIFAVKNHKGQTYCVGSVSRLASPTLRSFPPTLYKQIAKMLSSGAVIYGCRHRTTRKRKPDDVDKLLEEALEKVESDSLGPFWFQTSTVVRVGDKTVHVGLQQRERVELQELLRTGWIKESFLKDVLVPLNDESSAVPRLRMYNWAITNYAKGRAILTEVVDEATGETRMIDPCASYNSTLKRLHRTLFDPYRRGTLLFYKITNQGKEETHHTTVGQLLFVRWCIQNGIDKYVAIHETEIREHLNETARLRATKGKGRVRELTESKAKYARLVPSSKKQKMEETTET